MLIEINLLPQKEPKKRSFVISLASLLLVLVLVGAYYLWQINTVKNEVSSVNRQIEMTKKIAEKESKNNSTTASASSVSQLKSAIDWANDYPIQTIPVMRHLTSLLPERGFIQTFGYTEEGTITLSVQFDSAREAAYFLDHLNESKWISDASLISLSTASTPVAAAAAGTTAAPSTQTNTTAATSGTTTQPSTTATNQGTVSQDTTANTANQTKTADGTAVTTQTQTNITTGTVQNSTTNTVTTNNSTNAENDDNVLPRYTGQFEIKLNKEYVKEAIKKSEQGEKGVTGS